MAMSPRLLRPVASGFDPRRISGLVAWWDAQTASSYSTETGVSEWRDLSGNGNHLTQSITNNQPAISTMNGKTAFVFDGSNDTLEASSPVLSGVTQESAFSLFGVTSSTASESGYLAGNVAISPSSGVAVYVTGNYNFYQAGGPTSPATNATKGDNVAEVWGITHNNQTAQWGVNGTLSSAVSYANTFSEPTGNFIIGNRNGGTSVATFYSGLVGSVLVYSRDLTPTERLRLERWLGARWGINVA